MFDSNWAEELQKAFIAAIVLVGLVLFGIGFGLGWLIWGR
jgi:VIT1/CCC1 family predicted Fe2+/Mn2+ transporter